MKIYVYVDIYAKSKLNGLDSSAQNMGQIHMHKRKINMTSWATGSFQKRTLIHSCRCLKFVPMGPKCKLKVTQWRDVCTILMFYPSRILQLLLWSILNASQALKIKLHIFLIKNIVNDTWRRNINREAISVLISTSCLKRLSYWGNT